MTKPSSWCIYQLTLSRFTRTFTQMFGTLLPLNIYVVVNLASRTIDVAGNFKLNGYNRCSNALAGAKALRSVQKITILFLSVTVFWVFIELGLEYLLLFFFLAVFFPIICCIGSQIMLLATDYSFLLVKIIIYSLNVTIMNHLIKFVIINISVSESLKFPSNSLKLRWLFTVNLIKNI